jgi:cytochrome c556
MRKWAVLVTLGIVGVFALAATAAEKPSADYQKAMRDLGAVAQGLGKAVQAEDYDTLTKYTASAKAALEVALKFWQSKKVEDGIRHADNATTAVAVLGVSAGLKSQEGAEAAAKDLMAACAACHTAHREKLPDGTFEIK